MGSTVNISSSEGGGESLARLKKRHSKENSQEDRKNKEKRGQNMRKIYFGI